MTMPVKQPTLPPEGAYTDAEQLFISESPGRLFPENQNSNFGLLRRVLTSKPQEATDTLTQLVAQMFIATATGVNGYLGRWEQEMGLPIAPAGVSDVVRRSRLSLHRSIDLFSTARIRKTIESFLAFTSGGVATSLLPTGIPTDPAGFTLYGEGGSVQSQYRVYYNPRNFSYEVWIVNSSTPDLVTLTRELKYMTPAGQTVTIDNSKAALIDYGRTVLNKQPVAFYRMADFTDSSGYANHGTASGGVTALASPGLLTAGKNDDQAAKTFDGTTGMITAPDQNWLDVGDEFTIECWIKLTGSGARTIVSKGMNGYVLRVNGAQQLFLGKESVADFPVATFPLVIGTTYHIIARKAPGKFDYIINLSYRTPNYNPATLPTIENTTNALTIGRYSSGGEYFLGSIDELAIYNRWLTDKEIVENYNAGKAINP